MEKGMSPPVAHLEKTAQMVWFVSGLWFRFLCDSLGQGTQHLLTTFGLHRGSYRWQAVGIHILPSPGLPSETNVIFQLN